MARIAQHGGMRTDSFAPAACATDSFSAGGMRTDSFSAGNFGGDRTSGFADTGADRRHGR